MYISFSINLKVCERSKQIEMYNVYDDPSYEGIVDSLKNKLSQLKKECEDTDDQYPELEQLAKEYY